MTGMRMTIVACTLALTVLNGCSSGDGDSEATPTTAAGSATTAAGPATTVRPVDTNFTGQNSAQFCTLAKTYDERFADLDAAATPAQLRTVAEQGRTAMKETVADAPAEIKPDVQVVADAFAALFTELERVGFDVSRLSPNAFAALQSPEFQASTTRFQAYIQNVCGAPG